MKQTLVKTLAPLAGGLMALSGSAHAAPEASKNTVFGWINSGTVVGRVYDDRNGNGRKDWFERGMRDVVVYLDENDNATRDPGERYTHTSRSGIYWIKHVPVGDYVVRQEVPFGYRNTAGGDVEGPVITPTPTFEPTPVPELAGSDVTVQIIGGDVVEPGEYPFMVSVGRNFDGFHSHFCGGVLITDRFVATAAHCSENAVPAELSVLAGTTSVFDGTGLILDVKDIVLHPEYRLSGSIPGEPTGVSSGYDIAIWELREAIDLEGTGLQTLAMLSLDDQALAMDGVLATAVGWGASDRPEPALQDVHVPVFDTDVCADVYSGSINFDTQICAGAPEGGIDACQGDSGGPLLVRDEAADVWQLAGVTSYGNGCALPGNPGVWARVSELSDWVEMAAREPSRIYDISLGFWEIEFASFANQSTRREVAADIDPRWQLVNATRTPVEGAIRYDWRILDESLEARSFECFIDADESDARIDFADLCFSGDNSAEVDALEDGVYISGFGAVGEDADFIRSEGYILGSPPVAAEEGALDAASDPIDPDFPGLPFYIDYYEIEGLGSGKTIAVQVESVSLADVYFGIYDGDVREQNGVGGFIDAAFAFGEGSVAELIFTPQPGVRYVVGVTSFGIAVEGEYRIRIVNEGTPVATPLFDTIEPEFGPERRFVKDIFTRSLVEYPLR